MLLNNKENIAGKSPLVSVVMCTYNGEKFLQQQVDSILAQTYKNIELVVSDDASTDNTFNLLVEYAKKDSRVKYFRNEKTLGINKNFETAFAKASSEYIAISDQDDIWELNKIETIMNNWLPGSLFVYSLSGNFYGNNFNNRRPAPKVKYTHMHNSFQHVFGGLVHGHACMFKKELLVHCPPFVPGIFYDAWMGMYAVSTGIIGCVPQTLTWHRKHEKNSSAALISIEDKHERDRQLRLQQTHFLESFCTLGIGNATVNNSLLKFASLQKKMDGKKFSLAMFNYVMKNRKLIFHYKKKKPFLFFSYLKHALRMGRRGLL